VLPGKCHFSNCILSKFFVMAKKGGIFFKPHVELNFKNDIIR
jgi:hypothetical protein